MKSKLSLNRSFETKKMMKMLDLKYGQHVLDIGCGNGYWCEYFFNYTGKVTGVDPDGDAIECARKNSKNKKDIKYMIGSIENLPFHDDYFDRVTVVSVLQHLLHPEIAIGEIARVLKNNGRIAMSFDSLQKDNSSISYRDWHKRRFKVVNYFTKEKIIMLFKQFGLEVEIKNIAKIYTSNFSCILRGLYLRYIRILFILFPLFWFFTRLFDLIDLGGRTNPQTIVIFAIKR